MDKELALRDIAGQLGLAIRDKDNLQLIGELAEKVNELLLRDFNKLVSILYRMDVNEIKLRQLLKDNPDVDAGHLIAEMMIERNLQKIKSRQQSNSQRDNNIDENEKW